MVSIIPTLQWARETHSWSNKTWGYDGPDPEPSPVPSHLAWDLWLGTAPERPFSEGHFHPGNWRRWYDFGCGTMGDMAIHILDPVFSALQLGVPRSVVSSSSAPPKSSFGMQNHYHLFVDACLGGEPTTAHFGYSGPLTEAVLLGTLANRFPEQELIWQHESMQISNHDNAQRLLRRTYRQGFEVTHLS